MSKRYSIGNGWTRVKTRSGLRYFHKGKPTSGKKFSSAAKRIRNTRKERAKKDTRELRKKLKLKPLKKKQPPKKQPPQEFKLCRVKDREDFYNQIKADRKVLYTKISEEDYAELRVIIDIAPQRKGSKKRKKESGRGFRSFRSLKKLKNFLGLNYRYREDELKAPVDWTKRGVCQFEKKAYQSSVQLRGERVIGEKVWKRYAIKQP